MIDILNAKTNADGTYPDLVYQDFARIYNGDKPGYLEYASKLKGNHIKAMGKQ